MSRIIIEAIPQDQQRYDTTGDWLFNEDGDLVIRVTGTDPLREDGPFLVALHELIETKLCVDAGITQDQVDAFDFRYQGDGEGEPGDHPDAPYREQHRCAMLVEHTMALIMRKYDYGKVE